MQLQPVELVGDEVVGTGQEARPHAAGLLAEPEVEACRLHLVVVERRLEASAPLAKSAEMSESGRAMPLARPRE